MACVSLYVLVAVAIAGTMVDAKPQFGPSKDCERWCPRVGQFGQYDCCVHSGACPPPRLECPAALSMRNKPEICITDSACSRTSKCCYDTCLGHDTCKPAQ